MRQLEKRIAETYRQADEELKVVIEAYFESFRDRDAEMKKLIGTVQNGKIWTEQDYLQWRLNQLGRGLRFEALRDQVAQRYTQANATAVAYVNSTSPSVYALNRNWAAYTIERVAGNVAFNLWDEATVHRLILERPDLMPFYPKEKALKRGIDLAYGKQQITSAVTSGILQGKSVGKIAKDLRKRIKDMSKASAIRAARTATTGAQNGGRMDSYKAAEEMGIKIQKEWLATLDGRTRHSHRRLDGEAVNMDEEFSNGCRYPGDPRGKPAEVYNCRCTMVAKVKNVNTDNALRRDRVGILPNMTFAQWQKTKRGEGQLA